MSRRIDPDQIAHRRNDILTAAAELFATNGYEGTTVTAIANAAGFSSATVFYYFTDKPSVFRAIFEQDLPDTEQLIDHHSDSSDPVGSILSVLMDLAEDATQPHASGLLVALLRRSEDDPELLQVVTRSSEIVHQGLITLIHRGIEEAAIDPALDPDETATWLQALVDASFLNSRPGFDPRPLLHRTARLTLTTGSHVRSDQQEPV